MKKLDYIIATNRVKVSAAMNLISNTTAGDRCGISGAQKLKLLSILTTIESKMFEHIDAAWGEEEEKDDG
jgi:hypothetical protein